MYKYAQRLLWGSVAGSGTGAGDSGAGGSKQKSELGSSMQQQGVHHLVGRRCGLVGCASASTATGTDAAATGTASVSSDLVRSLRALLQGDSSLPGGMSDTATGGQRGAVIKQGLLTGLLVTCLLDAGQPVLRAATITTVKTTAAHAPAGWPACACIPQCP